MSKHGSYARILRSITVTIFLTITILSAFLYVSVRKIMKEQAMEIALNTMTRVEQAVQTMTSFGKNITFQVYRDFYVSKLINFPLIQPRDLTPALIQLDSYRYSNPFVTSIYVYNHTTETFYISSENIEQSVLPTPEFYQLDPAIEAIIAQHRDLSTFIPIARTIESRNPKDGLETTNCYTFFFCDPFAQGDSPNGMVFVNISEVWLHSLIEANTHESEMTTFIMDTEGRLLTNGVELSMGTNIADRASIREILDSPEPTGFVNETTGTSRSMIVYAQNDFDWIYASIISEQLLLRRLGEMRNRLIIIAFSVLITGLLASYLVSRRIYTPIRAMESTIQALEQTNRSQTKLVVQQLTRNLINDTTPHELTYLNERFKTLGVPIAAENPLLMVVLRIDRYLDFEACQDHAGKVGMKDLIRQTVQEGLSNHIHLHGVDMGADEILLIGNVPFFPELPQEIRHEIRKQLEDIGTRIRTKTQYTVTTAVSRPLKDFNEVHAGFMQTLAATDTRVFFGPGHIVFTDEIDVHKALDFVFTPSYDDELSRVISEGKLDQAHRIVSSMLLETRDFPIEIYTITLSRIMVTVQGLLPLMFDDENRPDIQQLFSRLEQTVFFDDTLDCLDRIFQGIQLAFETQRSSRTLNLVTEMKGFIEEHYGNHELSLDLIADRFGFTPTYLGRVFRKTACKTILDHITEVRMARARDLLENTDLRVADIAVRVGYSDSSYFHRAFKRHHLVSPMMYRNTYLERRPSS